MKFFFEVSAFVCLFFMISAAWGMEKKEVFTGVVTIPNGGEIVFRPGDRVTIQRVIEPEETMQEDLPAQSLGGKIFDVIWPGIAVVGTTLAAGFGEFLVINALNDYEEEGSLDRSSVIMAGTTVGIGVCALGMCTYGCGVAIKKSFQKVKAKKDQETMRFVTGDDSSEV